MHRILPYFIILAIGFSSVSYAENLIHVYQQAKENNPELRKSAADRDAAFEKINQSRSTLLPQIGVGGTARLTNGIRDTQGLNSTNASASLSLNQTIFDLSKWRQLSLTEKQASIQNVAYRSAEQTLLLNTATTYFNVLRSLDTLFYTEANKDAIYGLLDQITQRYNAGLVSIIDVQDARTQYALILADEISAKNNVDNSLESLRKVTGKYYSGLSALDTDLFSMKAPKQLDILQQEAETHNLALLSARLGQELASEQVEYDKTGYMPTLNATASSGIDRSHYNSLADEKDKSDINIIQGQNTVGAGLHVELYSGGKTNSKVKQAQYSLTGSNETFASTKRSVIRNLRSSYNNILASISGVKAYGQSVVSEDSSLNATKAGYQAGTRTIVDVLRSTSSLYKAKESLANSRYDYLINQLNIKYAIGTLNIDDLNSINEILIKTGKI